MKVRTNPEAEKILLEKRKKEELDRELRRKKFVENFSSIFDDNEKNFIKMAEESRKRAEKFFDKYENLVTDGTSEFIDHHDVQLMIKDFNGEGIANLSLDEDMKPKIQFLLNFSVTNTEARKDKAFMINYNKNKEERVSKQKTCELCNKEWSDNVRPLLHHNKIKEQEEQLEKYVELNISKPVLEGKMTIEEGSKKFISLYKGLLENYKSLKDTILICSGCHAIIHADIVDNRNKIIEEKKINK